MTQQINGHTDPIKDDFELALAGAETISFEEAVSVIRFDARASRRSYKAVIGGLVAFLVLSAVSLLPVTTEETVGFIVSGEFEISDSGESLTRLQQWFASVRHVFKRARFGKIRDLQTDHPVSGLFSMIGATASFEASSDLRDSLLTIPGVGDVFIQPIEMEVRRPLVFQALPRAFRTSKWAARISLGGDRDADRQNQIIQSHLSDLGAAGVNLAVLRGAAGSLQLEISSPSLGALAGDGRNEMRRLMQSLEASSGREVSLGAMISGRIWPDSSTVYSTDVNLKHRQIFGDRPGFVNYGFILDNDGTDRWETIYISIPGIDLQTGHEIAARLADVAGVANATAQPLTIE